MNQDDQLKQHYINFHDVDPNNHFFVKLFKPTKQRSRCQKCLGCLNFLAANKHKVLPNLLKDYSDGKTNPFEEKPIEIEKLGNITTYEITVENHGTF